MIICSESSLMCKQRLFSRMLQVIGCISTLWCLAPLRADPQLKSALEGRVIDATGAAIPGARVFAAVEPRVIATTGTDRNGEFSLLLAPGQYTLTVAADGFADDTREVSVAEKPVGPVVIQLQIGPRAETVTVTETASYQAIETSSATRTSTPLIDVPQSVSIITTDLAKDQMMMSIGDVVTYVPGITAIQGENNRD